MKYEKTLLTVDEFCHYVGIGKWIVNTFSDKFF